ncbi:MAG: hypothetical protein QG652_623, partial [Pseudomonadota bacterium]|nr:hypothetical protein [Pseudomonadota bacterium]
SKLAAELTLPSQNVPCPDVRPVDQYCLKTTGKNPAITTVANTELAQSYKAQDRTGRE